MEVYLCGKERAGGVAHGRAMALSISAFGIQKVNYTLIQFLLTKRDASLSINFH